MGRRTAVLSLCAIAVGTPVAAHAQAADAEGIGDIVVTAQRRSERLQDVPVTVAAFTSERLQAAAIQSTSDLAVITPGLTMGNTSGFLRPNIRGVGTTSVGAGLENSVATYIDGIYIASQPAALLSLSDIERVEVLKGPQGTLFGRNATGGVIQVVTRQPGDEFSGSADIGYGNYDAVRGNMYLTGPLADNLAASATVSAGRHGAFGKNLLSGRGIHNTKLDLATRGKLRWSDGATSIALSGDYTKYDSTEVLVAGSPGAQRLFAPPFTGGYYDADINIQPSRVITGGGGALQVSHDLGGVTLTSITAYRKLKFNQTLDGDAGPTPVLIQQYTQRDRQFSQEIQLASNGDGRLQWQIGAYYFDFASHYDPYRLIQATATTEIDSKQSAKSYAGFAQATWEVMDGTKVTAGVRITDETKRVRGQGILLSPAGVVTGQAIAPVAQKKHYTPLTWRIALDHRFSADVMAYVSYSRGFKSGGYNAQTPQVIGYDPERLDAYEVGLKSDLLDRKVRLNLSAFYYNYSNIQVAAYLVATNSQIYNGAKSRIYGLDFDLEARPARGLTLTASAEALHDRFTDFPRAVISTPNTNNGGYTLAPGSAKGNRLPFAADFTVSLGADYSVPVSFGTAGINVAYYHSTGFKTEPDNRLKQSPYDTLNATIRIAGEDDSWFARLWGRNLTNSHVKLQHLTAGITEGVGYAAPRTYGITIGTHF